MNKKQFLLIILLAVSIAGTLVNSDLFAYKTLTSYFLYTLFASIVISFSGIMLLKQKLPLNISFTYPLLLFVFWGAYIALHPLLTNNGVSFKGTYLIISMLLLIALLVLFTHAETSFRWIILIISIFAIFEAVVCIAQYLKLIDSLNEYFPVTGTQINPNITAMFIAMAVPASCAVFFEKAIKFKAMGASAFILSSLALYLLDCRTAYIGALLGALIFLNLRFGWTRNLWQKRKLVYFVFILLGIALIIPISINSYRAKQASADGRSTIWHITAGLIAEKPFLGYGYGQFERNYNLQQARYFESGKATDSEKSVATFVHMAYNEYLENAIEGGIVGVGLFVAALIMMVLSYNKHIVHDKIKVDDNYRTKPHKSKRNLRLVSKDIEDPLKDKNRYTHVAFASICAFAAMSISNFTIQAVPVWLLFIVYTAMLCHHYKVATQINILTLGRKIMAICLLMLGLYFGYNQTIKAIGLVRAKQASQLMELGKTQQAISIYSLYEKDLANSESFLQEYARALFVNGGYMEALTKYNEASHYTSSPDLYTNIGFCYQKIGDTVNAEKSFTTAMYMVPSRFYARYQLMNLYAQTGDTAKELKVAQSILDMPVKVPSTEIDQYKTHAKEIIQKYTAR